MFEQESVIDNSKKNEFQVKDIENLNYQIYEKDKYCYMITRNKCNYQFNNNDKIIQCSNCKSNFCMKCFNKGYTHVKTISQIYFKCPSCDQIGTELYITNQQSCLIS